MTTAEYQQGIRALLCTGQAIELPELHPDEIDRFIKDPGNLLWLDVDTSITTDLGLLKREFDFHELALEDAVRPHQRSKIDAYDGYSFLIFYAVTIARRRHDRNPDEAPGRAADEREGAEARRSLLHLHQIAMFVGSNYLVTVHDGPLAEIDEIAERWRANLTKIEHTIGSLLYSLLDTIVDAYFPVVDRIGDLVEDIEEAVFERYDEQALEDIFSLKKSLLGMRRVIAPERDMVNVLIRRDAPLFGPASVIYFQDVYDHLVRVADSVDIYRDLLSSALDAYLSMTSNRLNQVMKTLTSWSIPLMAGALLAGIWGMNFEHMPELDERYGYLLALVLIAGSIVGIVVYFRRKRWL